MYVGPQSKQLIQLKIAKLYSVFKPKIKFNNTDNEALLQNSSNNKIGQWIYK